MNDEQHNANEFSDDMAEYLPTFLDETEEQIDDLVETMLVLEQDVTDRESLNEAFRLIHSIKGSAGMMGLDNISMLTHHLENRFERFRSGSERLDEPIMNIVLRCIDFLRLCNSRLREGKRLGSAVELLEELQRLDKDHAHTSTDAVPTDAVPTDAVPTDAVPTDESRLLPERSQSTRSDIPAPVVNDAFDDSVVHIRVTFRAGLALADLKAQLIVARLADLGNLKATQPEVEQLSEADEVGGFEMWMETQADQAALRAAIDVEGVEAIEILERTDEVDLEAPFAGSVEAEPSAENSHQELAVETPASEEVTPRRPAGEAVASTPSPDMSKVSAEPQKAGGKVAETMRVDIDRLDHLMNLAGELVVNRARFEQISGQLSPALRNPSISNRIRDFTDNLRRIIQTLEQNGIAQSDLAIQIQQLRSGVELMEGQSEIWDSGRRCFTDIAEAIDQLTRVSHSLQRGVLDTRMVPVAPLFNRFKRVVRDLSKERGKQVNLVLKGDQTELDKRMIDELGDPLVHLVRNSIDHGLESGDVRLSRGKPEAGTIVLEASHRGNHVYICIRDDGGGISVARIREKLLENRMLPESVVAGLSDNQLLEYIWDPGFSTAREVTDVSGRGVGMDVVKTRIEQLNGTVELASEPDQGTLFTIRLPLTLAIINSLLVRVGRVTFAAPIDDIREIVSVKRADIVTVNGKATFEARGEFLPLVDVREVFAWQQIQSRIVQSVRESQESARQDILDVVVLHAGGKTLGLIVDELMGSQDIVIKSLSDNFMPLHGLSGASVLGDGDVCLLLDVNAIIETLMRPLRTGAKDEMGI